MQIAVLGGYPVTFEVMKNTDYEIDYKLVCEGALVNGESIYVNGFIDKEYCRNTSVMEYEVGLALTSMIYTFRYRFPDAEPTITYLPVDYGDLVKSEVTFE